MLSEDILYSPIKELAGGIREGRFSPVELAESYLERIQSLDPKLHAFVTVTREQALAEAREAEAEIASGRIRGPLHGIPYGAKDLLATAGIPTTWGAKPYRSQVFDFDATVVRSLREAGAVLLGKLAMVELAGGLGYITPDASLTGAARNPWDTGYWTCGSSSGAAAAVSAGLVPFAIGSETWGSILCPSSFCGISGLRPTFGRVSRHGAMALSWTMDKLGPMARTAEDCETVLSAIAGADPLDSWSAEEPPAKAATAQSARGFRAAFVRLDFEASGDPEIRHLFEGALAELRASGLSVEEVPLPDFPYEAVANVIVSAEAASAFESLFQDGRVRELGDPWAAISQATSKTITAADYVKASRIRALCQEAMARFFERWDVLLSPGEMISGLPADQSFENVSWSDPVGAMGNLCGLPALAVPCGFTSKGLPAGMSIVAGAFEEAKAVAVGRLYQGATEWHRKRPRV